MVTHNPLYRSQRAGLPHWALTLGTDVLAKIGIRMHDSGQGKPSLHQTIHSLPLWAMPLTAPTEGTIPDPANPMAKGPQLASIAGHSKIAIMPQHHDPQPLPDCRYGILQAPPKLCFESPSTNVEAGFGPREGQSWASHLTFGIWIRDDGWSRRGRDIPDKNND